MTTITRFTKEQLIADIAHAEEKSASLCGQCADDHARLAYWLHIAQASLEADPVAVIDKEGSPMTRAECNDDRIFAICCKVGTPLYAEPPAPVVPEEKPMPKASNMFAIDAVAAIAEVRGWNACRSAMLQGSQPVSDELPVYEIECDICGFKSTDPDGAHYCCEDNSDD